MNVVFIAHYFAVQEAYLQADMDGTTYHFLPPQKLKPPTPADVAAQSHFVVVLLSGCLTGFPGAADDGRGGGGSKVPQVHVDGVQNGTRHQGVQNCANLFLCNDGRTLGGRHGPSWSWMLQGQDFFGWSLAEDCWFGMGGGVLVG